MVQHAARRHRDAGKALKLHAAEWLKADQADQPLAPKTDQPLAPRSVKPSRSATPGRSAKASRSAPASPDAPRKGWGVLRASVRTEVDILLEELTLTLTLTLTPTLTLTLTLTLTRWTFCSRSSPWRRRVARVPARCRSRCSVSWRSCSAPRTGPPAANPNPDPNLNPPH